MIVLVASLVAAFVFAFAGDALFLLVRRLDPRARSGTLERFVVTRGCGPALVSLLSYWLLLLFPHRSPVFYIGSVTGALLIVAWPDREALAELRRTYREAGRAVVALFSAKGERLLRGFVAALLVLVAVISLNFPIVEHDALVAAINGRMLDWEKDLSPITLSARVDPVTGFYFESQKPPLLPMLYFFFAQWGDEATTDLLIRMVSPCYALLLVGLVALYVGRLEGAGVAAARERLRSWSLVALATCPLFIYAAYNNGLDCVRFFLSLAGLGVLSELARRMPELPRSRSVSAGLAAGLLAGFGLYSHMLSLPILAAAGLLVLLRVRTAPGVGAVIACALAGLLTSGQYHYLVSGAAAQRLFASIDRTADDSLRETLTALRSGSSESASLPQSPDATPTAAPARLPEEPPPTPTPDVDGDVRVVETAATESTESSESSAPTESAVEVGTGQIVVAKPHSVAGPAPGPDGETADLASSAARQDGVSAEKVSAVEEESHSGGTTEGVVSREAEPEPEQEDADERVEDRHSGLLEARGHGSHPLTQLLFGRLQAFTGIEHFGLFFWLLVPGLLLLRDRSTFSWAALIAIVLTVILVFSGVRKLSWSNPRYVGTILPIGAVFAGYAVTRLENRLRCWLRCSRLLIAVALCSILTGPLALVSTIRGTKVEITNDGSFYRGFRSFAWMRELRDAPTESFGVFIDEYCGLCRTVRYAFAAEDEQLRASHDYFAATLYFNTLPAGSKALLFRDARFFYYTERQGAVWYSPEIGPKLLYRGRGNPTKMCTSLRERGFTHVLVDDYSRGMLGYQQNGMDEILADRQFEPVYVFGTATVYGLHCSTAERIESTG